MYGRANLDLRERESCSADNTLSYASRSLCQSQISMTAQRRRPAGRREPKSDIAIMVDLNAR
jgi:hypothetical protein